MVLHGLLTVQPYHFGFPTAYRKLHFAQTLRSGPLIIRKGKRCLMLLISIANVINFRVQKKNYFVKLTKNIEKTIPTQNTIIEGPVETRCIASPAP